MKVRFTPRALNDLLRIERDLKDRSPAGAARIGARIRKRISDLELFPRQGVAENSARKLVVTQTRYIVLYRVLTDVIAILTIYHSSQDRRRS